MACPADVNTGWIQITGAIPQASLNSITVKSHPVTISFGPRTTPPTLSGNQIEESATANSCIYKSKPYQLNNIQICKVCNQGYQLPGFSTPRAELILSFVPSGTASNLSELSGILLCLPIYESSVSHHHAYLQQLIDTPNPSAKVPTLESLFYEGKEDMRQTSLAYQTCFETMNGSAFQSRSLYVIVFPNGIELTPASYAGLIAKIGGTLKQYAIPIAIRGTDPTLKTYHFDAGVKTMDTTSTDGYLYTTPISSSSDDFIHRFTYYSKPPKPSSSTDSITTPYYKTSQYKCMPFNQLRDLDNTGKYVIPGNRTMDTILTEQQKMDQEKNASDKDSPTISTSEMETIAASMIGVVIVGGCVLAIGSWIASKSG